MFIDNFELAMNQIKMNVESAYSLTNVILSENKNTFIPSLDYVNNNWTSKVFLRIFISNKWNDLTEKSIYQMEILEFNQDPPSYKII